MPLAANALALVRDLASRLSDRITDSVDSLPAPIHTAATDLGVSTATLVAATATTTLLATTALAASRRHRSRRQARTYGGPAPPHVKHLVPFFGSMVAFGMDPIGFLQRNQQELGDVFTFTMFGREMTFALGPDGNHLVFNAKLTQASAEQAYNSLTKPVFGEKVVYDTDNHRFMDQKKFGKTGMSNENLRAYVPMIEAETRDYLARWTSASDSKELFTALSELTIMTASRCLMGPEVRSRLDDSVAKLYHDLDQGFQPVNFLFEWLPLPSYWRRDRAHVKMRNLFLGIMRQRRASGMDKEEYTDVLQVFMNAKYRSGDQFTELEAAHMMIALLMAGQHTSSTTGTWALSFLADHPDVWKAVEDELARELGGDLLAGELTYDVLKRCELLDSVVRETLRLRPPITSIMRKVIAPIEFKGYVIPPGHYICAAPAVSHLDGAAFEDAEQFKPTRWMSTTAAKGTDEEEAQGKDAQDFGFGLVGGSARSHYLPFGAGRHRCIGEQFAYVQLKTIIASVVRELRSLRFEGKNKFPARDFTSMIVMPERPVMVSYERRVPPKKRVPERTGSSTSLVGEDGINKQQRQGSAMAAETY